MKKIAIFGAGGFGREVAQLILDINKEKPSFEIIGFYDDGLNINEKINDWEVLGGIEELNQIKEELFVVFAIGDPKTKENIFNKVRNKNIKYPVLIHPQSILGEDKYIKVGEGTIITAGCVITTNIEIGRHVILNLCCTVGHDVTIENFCSFMPSVNISGEVQIGKRVFVGTGAKIINLIEVGENVIIGAGAVVSKNIPANCTAVGIPAKPIKFHNE